MLVHEGIGEILFGMFKENILNNFDSRHLEELDDSGDVDIHYPELGLSFTFWKEFKGRLGSITSNRENTTLSGVKLIGRNKNDVRKFINSKLKSGISEENGCEHEDGDIQEWIDADDKSLSFWFLNDRLYQICWSCEWADNEQPKWKTTHNKRN